MEEQIKSIIRSSYAMQDFRLAEDEAWRQIKKIIRNEFSSLVSKIEKMKGEKDWDVVTVIDPDGSEISGEQYVYVEGYNKGIDDAIALIEKEMT